MRSDLPPGTVTFLFTDVEGSTRLLQELGAEPYAGALAEHRRVVREACGRHGGVEVDTQGDAFFVAFPTAPEALAAARAITEGLEPGLIRVRIGVHTGTPLLTDEGYVGEDVHFAARVAACSHGGQVVLSRATRDLVSDGLPFTDLGEHRLKDIEGPVWIYQLGSGRFPPLKTISNTNLPRPASSFVGRERELSRVTSLLREGARLVTLSGPGGSGKTRLAIEAASELVPEYANGVFWVGLAALRDPALVAETVAQTLGAKDGLAEHIGERQLLLLLDNLEQVVEAASELASLLEACPNLCLLVTSRELLRVRGEVEYPVPPLAEAESVELFCGRSRLDPDDTIGELCRRLDSLPLAVELAAARTRVLSPAQILERLSQRLDLLKGGRDADPRQQTLRATIEWSHDLLTEEEQQLFARLSVFAGGCTLDAAEQIAEADLDTLQSLVEKSLLRHTNERYWMLETIREYASERLEELGEAEELRRQHADYFAGFAETTAPRFWSMEGRDWLARVDADLDNLRAALVWSFARAPEQALRMGAALSDFWLLRDHLTDAERWLDAALPIAAHVDARVHARALYAAGRAAHFTNQAERAAALYEEALPLAREAGETLSAALCLSALAIFANDRRDYERAEELLEEALDLLGRESDEAYRVLHVLGEMLRDAGEFDRAKRAMDESLAGARAAGSVAAVTATTHSIADLALDEGDAAEAAEGYREALRLALETGTARWHVYCLAGLASCAAIEGDDPRAALLWGGVESQEASGGFRFAGHERPRYARAVEAACLRCPEDVRAGRAMELEAMLQEAMGAT